jgi:hypothetical protein
MNPTRTRRPVAGFPDPVGPISEELLVADDRAGLTPSEMVERKLVRLLKTSPLPVSQLSTTRRLIQAR